MLSSQTMDMIGQAAEHYSIAELVLVTNDSKLHGLSELETPHGNIRVSHNTALTPGRTFLINEAAIAAEGLWIAGSRI